MLAAIKAGGSPHLDAMAGANAHARLDKSLLPAISVSRATGAGDCYADVEVRTRVPDYKILLRRS